MSCWSCEAAWRRICTCTFSVQILHTPGFRTFCQPGAVHVGVQESTAEVEHELLELWSSVEKDKDARRELAAATHVARQMQRHANGRHHKQVCTCLQKSLARVLARVLEGCWGRSWPQPRTWLARCSGMPAATTSRCAVSTAEICIDCVL